VAAASLSGAFVLDGALAWIAAGLLLLGALLSLLWFHRSLPAAVPSPR
jgi:hypothetical protein